MTTPIHSQQTLSTSSLPGPPSVPAPSGIGAAPTTLASAAAPAPQEKGYIETGVLAVKAFIIRLFAMICSFFSKAEPVLPPPALPPLLPQVLRAEQPPQLKEETQLEIALLTAFTRLEPLVQNHICRQVGNKQSGWLVREDPCVRGKALIEANPRILEGYITLPT